MNNISRGMTLVEIMVTVSLLGVLAMIADFTFQGFRQQAYISEALMVVQPCKQLVTDKLQTGTSTPTCTTTSSQFVASVTENNATITVTLSSSVGQESGKQLIFRPKDSSNTTLVYSTTKQTVHHWDCTAQSFSSSYDIPSGCH